ncbi:hypothetical protein CRM22_003705 [Opisthorchis felineus]|uniref:Vacuolar ATPase assembly integral membrane protein vma21 n=2 Tax=Opisthorchiidae TaxID=6196 RepID=A0A8T1MP75_CLOSI|nr:vacuolar ATPase assembly integral membrane protein vma21 [Clonorchis sinensis]TGZ69523.1 hypothetical protein CRM22_003705 [Opisthorchis felineus]
MAIFDPAATKTLVFFSLLIVTLPLASFFTSKCVFVEVFNVTNSSAYLYGAVVAIVVVHLILLSFVIVAFSDSKKDSERKTE